MEEVLKVIKEDIDTVNSERIMWPAVMFAANRNLRVMGRIE